MDEQLELFLKDVNPALHSFFIDLDASLKERGCGVKAEQAKSGLVISYVLPKTKKVLCNYVMRKSGPVARIYGDKNAVYAGFVLGLPEEMKESIAAAPDCKRLYDPTKCNSRCPMGYTLFFGEDEHKKCRYSAFMFEINGDSAPFVEAFIKHELDARLSN